MARNIAEKRAKRATRANPREERNQPYHPDTNPRGQRESDETSFKTKKKVELLPRNLAQEDYCDALLDPRCTIVFAMGSAGTGKTMLAAYAAMKGMLDGTYEKIIITRPAVGADGESHGFLPGDLNAKMEPWVLPILDYFKEVWSPQQLVKMIQNEVIQIAPLAYMRGRTLKNAFILGDELQNTTPSQMKMLLTRIGEGSKLCCTGDLNQHDRNRDVNGLKDFVQLLKRGGGSEMMSVIEFGREHVERHAVIEEVLRVYGEE